MRYQNDNPPFLATGSGARPLAQFSPAASLPVSRSAAPSSVPAAGGGLALLCRKWLTALADGPWSSIAVAAGLLLLALLSVRGG
jgi:hypothetical protein